MSSKEQLFQEFILDYINWAMIEQKRMGICKYLVKWRADNVANYSKETDACWAVEYVQWANKQDKETLPK